MFIDWFNGDSADTLLPPLCSGIATGRVHLIRLGKILDEDDPDFLEVSRLLLTRIK